MFPDLAGTRWLNIWRQGWCSVPVGGFSAQCQPGESGLHAVCVSGGRGAEESKGLSSLRCRDFPPPIQGGMSCLWGGAE